MTQDPIIRMALEAELIQDFGESGTFLYNKHKLERFYKLAFEAGAAHERDKKAEQEPVGYAAQSVIDWLSSEERTASAYSGINLYKNPTDNSTTPLYAAPVSTKDLTDEIDNAKREERKALGENNGKRTMDGNSEYGVTGCNGDCYVIGSAQEPLIDLSKIKHEDKCRYWDDESFCDCGADLHVLLKWHRSKGAAAVRTKDLTDGEIDSLWTKVPNQALYAAVRILARAVIAKDREKNRE